MTGPVWRLLAMSRPVAPRLVLAATAGTAAALCGVGLMATAAWLISRASLRPPVLALGVAIVGVRAFGLSRGIFRYGERLAGHDAALRVLATLRTRCYAKLARLVPAGESRTKHGDVLQRLLSDVDAAVDVLVRAVVPYAVAAATGIGAAVLLAVLLPLAAAALVGGLALVGVVAPAVQHAAAGRAARRTAPLRGELTASAVQLLHGLPDLVAYGAVGERLAGLRHTGERLRRGAGRAAAMTGLAAAIVALASGGCVLLVLRLATPAVRAETLDGVLLAVVVLTPLAVFEAVAGLPAATEQLGTARSGLRRVFALLDEPEPVGDPDMVTALPAWPCRLRVRNASARWSPATSPEVASGLLDAPLAVEGVSLDLPPGRRIALVGPTGCGKSTVAALLVRFLDPVAGSVTLDGVDLRALTGDQVREMVTLVDAEAHLFDTTIEANLRVARADATDDQLRAALRAACLLDFVDGLPDGLDTRVGERGTALSGGQRRRLALARGLLRDPRILVLDEPTEHLDEPTAREITADLLAATRGRTVVLITHRPFGLADVDEVVTLPATMRP